MWMAKPQAYAGCPPGLEYLTKIDHLLVKQHIDVMDMMTRMHLGRKYRLFNRQSQQVYFVTEERQFSCCKATGFSMNITDCAGMNVIRLQQDSNCCNEPLCACLDCCTNMIEVEAPAGHVIGYCKQQCGFCVPKYGALDAQHNTVIDIAGPCCTCPCFDIEFSDVHFRPDNFELQFPMNLNVKIKAVLIGTSFLLNALHFKETQSRNSNRRRHR